MNSSISALDSLEPLAPTPRLSAGGELPCRFGRYQVLEEISRGGAGVVFRARDEGLRRDVALKFLRAGSLASRDDTRRLFLEARAAARLNHPGIVPVFEVGGPDEAQPFLAMSFLPGGTLAQRLKQGAVPLIEAARLLATVARAVHHAHQHGILHRDLKPGNILFDADSAPLVADFGLARVLDEDETLTRTDAVLGTPAYLSPEQAAGRSGETTTATDIHALGAILYECLTGRPPFSESELPRLLRQIAETPPIPPRRLNPRIPSDLETICLKCLEKEPTKRYATAQELAEELERFLNDEPIHARPVTTAEKVWRWCRRNPVVSVLAAVTVVLLLVLAIGAPIAAFRINRERQHVQAAAVKEIQLREAAQAQAYTSDMNVVQQAWDDGNLRRAQEKLRKYVPDPGEPDLRGFEWRYLWKLCQDESHFSFTNFPAEVRTALSPDAHFLVAGSGSVIRFLDYATGLEMDSFELPDGAAGITALAFLPTDTNVLATVSGQTVHFWDLAGKRRISTLTLSNPSVALAFSPDGKLLAVAGGYVETVELWRVEERSLVWARSTDSPVFGLIFAPDGKSLITSGGPLVWDLATGTATSFPIGHRGGIHAFALSPDGLLLATGSQEATVIVWDLAQRKVVVQLIGLGSGGVHALAFSPNGRCLAIGNEDGTVRLWDIAARRQKTMYRGHQSDVINVAFSSDGSSVMSSSWDRAVKIWDVEPQSLETTLPTNTGWVRTSVFSPDNKWLITRTIGQGGLKVWDVAARSLVTELTLPFPDATGPAGISPDNKTLVLVADKRIALWDAATFAPRGMWTNDFDPISLAFSPDSRTLAVSGLQGAAESILDGITNRLAFWDVASQRKIHKLPAAAPFAVIVNFSHDGKQVAIGYLHGEVCVWDYESERPLGKFTDQHRRIWSVAFSHDDTWVVAGGSDGVVTFHELGTQRTFSPIPASTWISGLAFTPDGKTLASNESDGTVRLWNFATREIALTLKGHVGQLGMDSSFSRDGKYLATCGADGTVRLWPAASLLEIPKFKPAANHRGAQ